jgi:hypothetical protein
MILLGEHQTASESNNNSLLFILMPCLAQTNKADEERVEPFEATEKDTIYIL